MPYSLKLEVDGWGLAVVVQELVTELKRIEEALGREKEVRRTVSLLNLRQDALGALESFVGHLPAGGEETYVLKFHLSPYELDALVGALRMAVARVSGQEDPRAETVRALHDQVVGCLDAVEVARRASGEG